MGHARVDWDRFVSEHAGRVLRIALRILGRIEDAEDVSQEVLKECLQVEMSTGMRDPTAVAVRLPTVRSLDKLRRRRARPEWATPIHDSDRTTLIGPSEDAVASELADWLRDAVAGLPPRQAEVFSLMAMENASREEVANLLGISVEATSTALFKARKALGAALERRTCTETPKTIARTS